MRSKREIVDPNEGFREQLQQFEHSSYSFTRALGIHPPLCRTLCRSATILSYA